MSSKPLADNTTRAFAQFGVCIAVEDWIDSIYDVYTDRLAARNSHHFCILSHIRIAILKTQPRTRVAVSHHKASYDINVALTRRGGV